jgi:disulfide bond formation protein DsbB
MHPDYIPSRPRRSGYYPVGLGVVFALCVGLALIAVSGGLLFYVLLAAAAIALLGLLHYAVWGHSYPAGTALRGAGTASARAWEAERDRENRH